MKRIFDRWGTAEPVTEENATDRGETIGRLQLGLVVLVILGALVISSLLSSTSRAPRLAQEEEFSPLVRSMIVTPAPHQIEITGSGAVRSQVNVSLVPQVQGRITSLSDAMQPGGYFTAGEKLFQVETTDYQLEVERLRSEVEGARTALQLEQAEGKAAGREWDEINPGEPVPDLVARKPQIKDRRAALAAAQARAATAQLNLDRTSFSLPFAGRIITSNIERGQFVSAGQSFGTAYALDSLEVAVPLADRDLKWLQPFDTVKASIEASYLGRTFELQAKAVRVAAELDERTRFANVIVELPNPADEEAGTALVPGVFVTVRFQGAIVDDIVALPTASIQENGRIWIIKDGRLESAAPTIIQPGASETLVRDLPAGVEVMISNLAGAIIGMAVRTPADAATPTE